MNHLEKLAGLLAGLRDEELLARRLELVQIASDGAEAVFKAHAYFTYPGSFLGLEYRDRYDQAKAAVVELLGPEPLVKAAANGCCADAGGPGCCG